MSFRARAAWALALAAALAVFAADAAASPRRADFGPHQPSLEARRVADWAMAQHDHQGLPFAVVDKKAARLYVFDHRGHLKGASSALLGQTVGDESAPAVGLHTQQGRVPPEERTTPAGRFVSQPGENLKGEHVVWVDYEAAFAIHRLRPGASLRSREARLASLNPQDHRASLGCVIVPVKFYKQVVEPVIGRSRAVVYVLPEKRALDSVLNAEL